MYQSGQGVGQSYESAVEYYRRAVQAGHAKAKGNLGGCYLYGQGVEQDPLKGLQLIRECARHPANRTCPETQRILAAVEGMFAGLPV